VARDPLAILQSVRLRSVEQARQALAVCLKAEAEAAGRVDFLDEAVKRDRAAGACLPDRQDFIQVFANRSDAVQLQRRAAVTALAAAQARVSEAQAEVADARTRAEAVEQLITERMVARQAAADGKAQHILDDIARAARAMRKRSSIFGEMG
jgi:hypothetical protein